MSGCTMITTWAWWEGRGLCERRGLCGGGASEWRGVMGVRMYYDHYLGVVGGAVLVVREQIWE